MPSAEPYLSIVVAARNDDHGGDFHKRMQVFIQGLLAQCDHHKLDAELVLVEWNPPEQRPRLKEVFVWPRVTERCTVRIIEVPQSTHVRFKNSDRIPFFQFIAKNVGIRRARGEFVLATNIDILFSDQLMARLARRDLNADSYYRIDRYDVPSHIPENASLDEQLNYCQNHVLRVFRRDGTYSHVTRAFYRIYPRSSGMFGKSLLLAERILTEMKIVASLFITNKTFRRNLLRYEHLRSNVQSGVYSDRLHRIFEFLETPQRSRLHTNASGDFTLMAKDRWSGLRGYPELTLHGMHIDSILCYMAHYLPLREMIFRDPMRIYHIDHLHSWTPEAGRTEAFYRRLRQRGIPWMSHEELNEFAISLMEGRRPIVFNDENWGLSGENLRETVFGPSQ